MKREIEFNIKTTLAVATFVLLAVSAFGQSQTSPTSPLPAAILGPELIVWSQLQEPRPVPQPLPPPDRPVPTPDQQPESGKTQTQAPAEPQQSPAAQTFTGTILKDGERFVLKVSGGNTYQLDDQEQAGKYEGKQVKVVGDLDTKGAMLHVVSIQLVS